MTDVPQIAAPAGTTCPRHQDAAVVGTCTRCGTFVCALDAVTLGVKTYCATCAARPDVDYLEAFRLKYWGRRDGWAWAFGLGGIANGLGAVALAVNFVESLPKGASVSLPWALLSAIAALASVNGILFWLGKPFTRWGLVVLTGLLTALQMAAAGPAGLAVAVIPLVVAVNVFLSWRTRLFFKLPVKRTTLQRAWDILHNNTIARQALIAGIAGLAIPGFSVIALIMGVIGLRRVDPHAYPPVGKKAYAVGGIAVGALGTLEWVAIVVFYQVFSNP